MNLSSVSRILLALAIALFEQFATTTFLRPNVVRQPHCHRTSAITASVTRENLDSKLFEVFTKISAHISYHQTACFKIVVPTVSQDASSNGTQSANNETLLFAFTFSDFHTVYPVRSQFIFGIPRLKSECICDCPTGEDHCAGHKRTENCTNQWSNELCYHSFHHISHVTGCNDYRLATVCCKIHVAEDTNFGEFTAFTLDESTAYVTVKYRIYTVREDSKSTDNEKVPAQKYSLVEEHDLKLSTFLWHNLNLNQKTAHVQIRSFESGQKSVGSTLLFSSTGRLPSGQKNHYPVLVNPDLTHATSLNSLGWFRKRGRVSPNQPRFTIDGGAFKLQAGHFVRNVDCQKQTYLDNFHAKYFTSSSGTHGLPSLDNSPRTKLGHTLESQMSWVRSAKYSPESRQVLIRHRRASDIWLEIELSGKSGFILSSSKPVINDFNASIHIDRHSNRFLNITFDKKAIGSFVIKIFQNSASTKPSYVLSAKIGERSGDQTGAKHSAIVPVPSLVNGSRYICIHPIVGDREEICSIAQFFEEPMQSIEIRPGNWRIGQGDCPNCNSDIESTSVSSFARYLNPMNWFDGLSNLPKYASIVIETGMAVIILIIFCCIVRQCFWPLIRFCCSCSVPTPLSKSQSTTTVVRPTHCKECLDA